VPRSLADVAWGLAAVFGYAGSLAIWPIYRLTRRGRAPDRALLIVFLANLGAMAAWTGLEIWWALRGGDWLHGLVMYLVINVLFSVACALARWARRVGAEDRA